MNKNKKIALVVALVLIAMVGIVYAVYTWHMEITWTPISEGIRVYKDADCTTEWTSPYTFEFLGDYPHTETMEFYIKNEGDVAVTVTITGEDILGCTPTWSTESLPLDIGASDLLTLSLEVTADGHYTFDFTSNA